MSNRSKSVVIAVIAVVIVPTIIVIVMTIPNVANFIKTNLEMNRATAISVMVDYLSLSYAILLGVIVYRQTERINQLEATQYDTYIGAESINYSCHLVGSFATNGTAGKSKFAHVLGGTEQIFLLNAEVSVPEDSRILLIPLSFIVKSQPLVVSIRFQRAHLNILEQQTTLQWKYDIGEKVNAIFVNGSHFVFCLGLMLPKQSNPKEIHFNLSMELENQTGKKQRVQSKIIMVWAENKFNILSSYSIPLT